MRSISLVAVSALALLQAGCPMVDFKELRFTHQKPAESDLLGSWTPTEATVGDIQHRGHYSSEIRPLFVLRRDHTFSMQNMPDWYFDPFGESHGEVKSLEGTWQLASHKDLWTVWTIDLKEPSGVVAASINVYRRKPPYLLFFRVGDPNDGYSMLFERIPQP